MQRMGCHQKFSRLACWAELDFGPQKVSSITITVTSGHGVGCQNEHSRGKLKKIHRNLHQVCKNNLFFSSSWHTSGQFKHQICHLMGTSALPLVAFHWPKSKPEEDSESVIHGHSDCCQTLSRMHPRKFHFFGGCFFGSLPLHNIRGK